MEFLLFLIGLLIMAVIVLAVWIRDLEVRLKEKVGPGVVFKDIDVDIKLTDEQMGDIIGAQGLENKLDELISHLYASRGRERKDIKK